MPTDKIKRCVFPHAVGLNRILRGQKYEAEAAADDGEHFSWPVPSRDEDSCNVIILGSPGTGKTRLALEMAARLRIEKEPGEDWSPARSVLYYSLEQTSSTLEECLKKFWPCSAYCCTGPDSGELPHEAAKRAGWGDDGTGSDNDGFGYNLVFFPQLSPRRLEQTGESDDDRSIFWRRYQEIRYLIGRFAKAADREPPIPPLGMVVIDSLNVFGDKPVSRYMIEQLFALFHESNLIGLCVAEDPEAAGEPSTEEPLISPGISNLADVVLRLGWNTEQGYSYRNIEVVKSRSVPNAYGTHTLKIRDTGIEVYPALHCWYTFFTGSEGKLESRVRQADTTRLHFGGKWSCGESVFKQLVKDGAVVSPEVPSILHTITGPMDTKKTQIALCYALEAQKDKVADGEGKLLLVSFDVSQKLIERAAAFQGLGLTNEPDDKFPMHPNKGRPGIVKLGEKDVGYQLWLCPGYLLAEELIHFVSKMLMTKRYVTRVVFLDIGQIPTRHPALAHQISEHGNLFVVLVELFRRIGVDACFVCTNVGEVANHRTEPVQRLAANRLSNMLQSISHGTVTTFSTPAGRIAYSGRFARNGRSEHEIVIDAHGIKDGAM